MCHVELQIKSGLNVDCTLSSRHSDKIIDQWRLRKAKPRSCTREFKMSILSQIEAGVPLAQVARENGLHLTLVSRWKKEY